jgi:hypothetical protein
MKYLVTIYVRSPDPDQLKRMDYLFQCMVRSFRFHNSDARVVVYTNDSSWFLGQWDRIECREIDEVLIPWTQKFNVLLDTCNSSVTLDKVIWCDTDMVFLDDPFTLDWEKMDATDMGCSSRMYPYKHSTTSAFMALMNTEKSRQILKDYTNYVPVEFRKSEMEYASYLLDVKRITDLGWYWDFCPGIEGLKRELCQMMYRRAAEGRSVGCIHLKGDMKYLIYDKEFQGLREIQCKTV